MEKSKINSNKPFIPNEILFNICSFLPKSDIFLRMRFVCKRFSELTEQIAFKKMLSQRRVVTVSEMLKKNKELVTFLRNCNFKEVTSSGNIKITRTSNGKSKEDCLNELLKNYIDNIDLSPIKKIGIFTILPKALKIMFSIKNVINVVEKFFKRGIEESNEEIKKSVEEKFELDFQINFADKAFICPFKNFLTKNNKNFLTKNKLIKKTLFNRFKPLFSKYSLEKFPANLQSILKTYPSFIKNKKK